MLWDWKSAVKRTYYPEPNKKLQTPRNSKSNHTLRVSKFNFVDELNFWRKEVDHLILLILFKLIQMNLLESQVNFIKIIIINNNVEENSLDFHHLWVRDLHHVALDTIHHLLIRHLIPLWYMLPEGYPWNHQASMQTPWIPLSRDHCPCDPNSRAQ